MAGEFKISRGCIRDAFLILESEGMIKSESNKYTRVLEFKQKDIKDLFNFRLILELFSIEACMKKKSIPSDILKQCIKKMEKAISGNNADSFEYVEEDFNFHEAIVESAHNIYVSKVYKSIKYQIMTILYFYYSRFNEEFSNLGKDQHLKIFNFMENDDIEAVKEFLREHVQNNLDVVIKLMNG